MSLSLTPRNINMAKNIYKITNMILMAWETFEKLPQGFHNAYLWVSPQIKSCYFAHLEVL